MSDSPPLIAIVMGSQSDWETMKEAADVLAALGVVCDVRIVSAHRTPKRLYAFAEGARGQGYKAIIAGAGGAAHLAGVMAAKTPKPPAVMAHDFASHLSFGFGLFLGVVIFRAVFGG